jgi:hypothetical protein
MSTADQPLTFIVRLFPATTGGLWGVVERVGTGRKDAVHTPEDVARVIAAVLEEQRTNSLESPEPLR